MPENGLLMIAPVRPGEERLLADALNLFGNDIRGRRTTPDAPRIDFPGSATIHFARLALLEDPDRGAGCARLLLATDFDGPLDEHLAELLRRTRRPEAIWGRLVGYTGPDEFAAFVRGHRVVPDAYYRAFPGTTLASMRRAIGFTSAYHACLAEPDPSFSRPTLPDALRVSRILHRFWNMVSTPFRVVTRAWQTIGEVMALGRRHGIEPIFSAALRINATLNRVWWIRPFNRLFQNAPRPRPSTHSQADPRWRAQPIPPGYPPEDAVLQNQLTLVTDIRLGETHRLAAVLALIDLYGRRLSTPGLLVGISTIHTVRWAIIDHGRRLLMVSNYDNTWENYIDEFAEMILSGLDALWCSAPDYPVAGAQDVAALKQFLRRHQAPANVFYSALPETSVLNLKQALEFSAWFRPIARWYRVPLDSRGAVEA
jgi:hypothetical protein